MRVFPAMIWDSFQLLQTKRILTADNILYIYIYHYKNVQFMIVGSKQRLDTTWIYIYIEKECRQVL